MSWTLFSHSSENIKENRLTSHGYWWISSCRASLLDQLQCRPCLFLTRDTQRRELRKMSSPYSNTTQWIKEKELGSCIITSSLVGPQFFHNWFLFTGKVNKTHQCKKNPSPVSGIFLPILDHQIYITAKAYWRLVFPIFFIETKLSRRDRHGSRRESGLLYWWISAGRRGLSVVSARPHPLLKTVRFISKKPGFQLTTDSSSHLWHVYPLFSSTSFSLWWIKSESSLFQFSWSISHSAKPPSIRRSLHFFKGRKK